MSHARRVEMDSAAPERVPPLPWEAEDYIDGAPLDSRLLMDRFDSVIDSGMDSLISTGSLQTDSSNLAGDLSNLTVQDTPTPPQSHHPPVTSTSQPSSQGQDSSEALSRIATESEQAISIDEAYHSSELALLSGGFEEVQRRIREIKSAFARDEDGDTQLHISIIQGVQLMTRHLIQLAPSLSQLSIQNYLLQTPLHLAALTNQPQVVRELVIRQIPLETRDHAGNTALHLACREGHLEVVHSLCNPVTLHELISPESFTFKLPNLTHVLNYDGETCLHLASASGHMHVISYLMQGPIRANINVKDGRSGRTVLHHAVEHNSRDIVFFLIRHCSADVNARTFDGSTPLMLAHGRRHELIQTMLQNAGADLNQIGLDDDYDLDSEDSDEEMMDAGFSDIAGAAFIST